MNNFDFDRREGFSLQAAVGQAVGAASMCWENVSGAGVFDDRLAKEISEALLAEVRRHTDAEVSVWKKRLNEETVRLRGVMGADRNALADTLAELFPKEFTPEKLAEQPELTTVQRTEKKLRELAAALQIERNRVAACLKAAKGDSDPMSVKNGEYSFSEAGHAVKELCNKYIAASNDLETERQRAAACLLASEGQLSAVSGIEKGHPFWSPAFEMIKQVREGAATAIFLANQRTIRAKKFMDPESFAETNFRLAVQYLGAGGEVRWEDLSEAGRSGALGTARLVSKAHAEAIEGNGVEQNPITEAILEEGNALTRALNWIEEAQKSLAYQRLMELDDFLRNHFPRQEIKGDDPELDAVRRATELLDLLYKHLPTLFRIAWNDVIRPALHTLEKHGIDILPPGTIVYGATPNKNVHRMD